MHLAKTYEQSGIFDPTNPRQVIREVYTPTGYSSFYFNPVGQPSALGGLGLPTSWATMPSWMQMAIVGVASTAAGYFAMAKWGNGYIKPALRKVGINLSGLNGNRTPRHKRKKGKSFGYGMRTFLRRWRS